MKARAIFGLALLLLCSITQEVRAQQQDAPAPFSAALDKDEASPSEVAGPAQEAATHNHLADPNYELQPDDVLEVIVFREPDLTTDGIVRKDGTFDMKLVGAVKVAGMTADQAAQRVRAALAKDYLVDPRVDVGMLEYARKKINILGEVRSPGIYAFPAHGPLLLSDAVALSGGFLPDADTAHVSVRRMENEKLVTLPVDAAAAGNGDTFSLKPDDSITVAVQPKRHFTVLGQIARPGTYDFTDSPPVYLTDAIAVAGGFTRIADPYHVLLKRTENGRETVRRINAKAMANSPDTQRLQLENEDTITVGESMF
jgi:polysaccharide export outer membrane protein